VDGQAELGLPVDLIEEVPEVDRPVLRRQVADHLPGGGVQRGEQVNGAVPDVVEAAPLGHAREHGQHRRGPLQRRDRRIAAAFSAGQHHPRPQRQPLRRLPPHGPSLQRPPLSIRQHQRLQPAITHIHAAKACAGRSG
jgi:hypothetical protein